MSLINEALKKAQRDRHLQNVPASPEGTPHRTAHRQPGLSKQTALLIGTGVLALFVISVVGTVLFINREPSRKPAAATIAAPVPSVVNNPISPSTPPPSVTAPAPLAPPAASAPPPIVISMPTVPSGSTGELSTSATAIPLMKIDPAPAGAATEKFDPRLQSMVDSWHVTAVRPSGNDSRVSMNGNVYRMGDVIDRTSGLRLTDVSATELTFTDSAGSTYIKRY